MRARAPDTALGLPCSIENSEYWQVTPIAVLKEHAFDWAVEDLFGFPTVKLWIAKHSTKRRLDDSIRPSCSEDIHLCSTDSYNLGQSHQNLVIAVDAPACG